MQIDINAAGHTIQGRGPHNLIDLSVFLLRRKSSKENFKAFDRCKNICKLLSSDYERELSIGFRPRFPIGLSHKRQKCSKKKQSYIKVTMWSSFTLCFTSATRLPKKTGHVSMFIISRIFHSGGYHISYRAPYCTVYLSSNFLTYQSQQPYTK